MVTPEVLSCKQVPLCTTALYWEVTPIFVKLSVLVVLTIVVAEPKLFVDDSHLTTTPVFPVSVIVALLLLTHTEVLFELMLPATVTGSVVMMAVPDVAAEQMPVPLVTKARYQVVLVKFR